MMMQDVTRPPGENAIFITLKFKDVDIDTIREQVAELCNYVPAITRSIRIRKPEGAFDFVMGFGATAWERLYPNAPKPKELAEFQEIRGAKYTAVSTPGDLFFHLRAKTMDMCYEAASMITAITKDIAESLDEVHGFRYLDGRAIIGFVDGTENPVNDEAVKFAVIGDEDAFFAGGSYAFAQKYLHDMDAWNALSTEEQEKAIGRRKFNDLELPDEDKAENAHNVVAKAEAADGNELKIMRANVAFANPSKGEFGTYFIGYAGKFAVTRQMLEQMFLGNPAGNYDRLLDFSTPVTGTLFFIPSYDILDKIAEGQQSWLI